MCFIFATDQDAINAGLVDSPVAINPTPSIGQFPQARINGPGDFPVRPDGSVDWTEAAYFARPSSGHPGGVNVVFADNHTKFLRDDISYRTYTQLITPYNRKSDAPILKKYILDDADYE